MAAISLRSVFIHDATDLDDLTSFVEFANVDQLDRATSGPATTRLYAGGNTRRTVGRGSMLRLTLRFRSCTPAEAEQLETWAADGTRLLYRDPRRGVHLAGFDDKQITVSHHPAVDRADVTATLTVVTDPSPAVPTEV
jgi:hypothetical protein